ncbi:MAG: site-specific integrase [Microbacteriaceae bacterium]|nr:site-specific integrase [Microbacteriaceae bacterium]
MGSVHPYKTAQGDQRYRVIYRKPDNRQGQKRGFTRKRDAELFLHSVEVKKATGEYIDASAGRVTVGKLGAAWLDGRAHIKRSSAVAYESAWRIHVEPKWGTVAVGDVKPSAVQLWVKELHSPTAPGVTPVTPGIAGRPRKTGGLSAAMVRRCYDILAGILDAAVDDRHIPRNPARGTKLPRKVKRAHLYLTHEQVDRLAEAAANDNALIIRLLAYTGLRWGELAGLHVGDLNMLRRRVTVNRTASLVGGRVELGSPKDYEQRSVPFPEFLAEPLARQCEGKGHDDIVFPAKGGGYRRTPTANARSWFEGVKARAGLPAALTIHDLRHTAASLAVSAGANVKAVQRMLGHASAAMTLDTYADLFDDDLDAVAGALDKAHAATDVAILLPRTVSGT